MSGGLTGQEFNSQYLSDIQPNTRIVAVCGITDYNKLIPKMSLLSLSEEEGDENSAQQY